MYKFVCKIISFMTAHSLAKPLDSTIYYTVINLAFIDNIT